MTQTGAQLGAARCLILRAPICLAEEPVKVTTCGLQKDPAAYNRKLVEVTSFVSLAFESHELSDAGCRSWQSVWWEYGGNVVAGITKTVDEEVCGSPAFGFRW